MEPPASNCTCGPGLPTGDQGLSPGTPCGKAAHLIRCRVRRRRVPACHWGWGHCAREGLDKQSLGAQGTPMEGGGGLAEWAYLASQGKPPCIAQILTLPLGLSSLVSSTLLPGTACPGPTAIPTLGTAGEGCNLQNPWPAGRPCQDAPAAPVLAAATWTASPSSRLWWCVCLPPHHRHFSFKVLSPHLVFLPPRG